MKKKRTPALPMGKELQELKARVATLETERIKIAVRISEKDQIIASQQGIIASLRQQMALAELRHAQGASATAVFDSATCSFVEPKKG